MSVIDKRVVTTARHEYVIPAPACWTDVSKAFNQAIDDREKAGHTSHSDDSIRVVGDGEGTVTVFWEEDRAGVRYPGHGTL